MLSTVSLAASARAGKFKSSTSHVKESPVAFGGCSVHARESPAGETWVYRSTCCRANSSPRSQQQYHQRLRDARAAADLEFSRLLSGTDLGKRRARSATDAGVLRRKGRLKEQDELIYFMMSMHKTHSCEEVFSKMQRWLSEHKTDPRRSKLKQLVPSVGAIFTELPLKAAFKEFDSYFALSRRRFVLPNFAEIRHILNIAQIHASAEGMRLITFDADGTLYADGTHLEHDNRMIDMMISLMQRGIHVAVVTAAGYPGEPLLFEARIKGLLDAFKARNLPQDVTDRFLMLGGECNYLLRYHVPAQQLQFVPDELWKSKQMHSWTQEDIKYVLDSAEALLTDCSSSLRVPVSIVRKERAVGVVPKGAVVYEQLEELAISAAYHLVDMPVPFCAFNGGADVFVDIGNKSLGLHALMKFLGATSEQECTIFVTGIVVSSFHAYGTEDQCSEPGVQGQNSDFAMQTLHVGDRFTKSGNDAATRDCCPILWVAAPEETCFFVDMLLDDIENLRESRYIE